jgi:hypothetical protein
MSNGEKPNDPAAPRPDQIASAEPEPFLARWSRRKAEARDAPPPAPEPEAPEATKPRPPMPEPLIDPATLPPIESLTAESDFTVFMRPGVPDALRKAALAKLWRTEPSVVNYVPLVEYNWDFNAPGYGALKATDDVAKLARQVWGGIERAVDEVPPAARPEPTGLPPPQAAEPPSPPQTPVASTEVDAEPTPTSPRRKHGGALPS